MKLKETDYYLAYLLYKSFKKARIALKELSDALAKVGGKL